MLRDGGRRSGQVSEIAGINSRLDEMQACYLRAFLTRLGDWNRERVEYGRLYDEGLRDVPGIRIPRREECSVCHLYVVRADRREALRDCLASVGIGTGVHYPVPLHLHPAFASCGLKKGDLPHAEKASTEIVSLPLWTGLGTDSVSRVVEAVRDFYRG